MSNALALLDKQALIPQHLAMFFDSEEGSNIAPKLTVPSLSYGGKVFSITIDGETTKIVKLEDGVEVPQSVISLVVLDYAKARGRAYYAGAFDPNNTKAPECWSNDGKTPDAAVPDATRQATSCAQCPMAAKGSRISDNGLQVAACSQHRMLAVVPANKLDMVPLRLKLAVTSDYDKQSEDLIAQGWLAFQNLVDVMRSRGVKHTAALVVKARFDPNVNYPKLVFQPARWLNEQELLQIKDVVKSDEVQKLLVTSYAGAADAPTPVEAPADLIPPQPTPAPAPVAAPPAAPKAQKAAAPAPAAPKAPKAKPASAPTPAPAQPSMFGDDDDEGSITVPGATAPAAAVSGPVSTGGDDELDSLLAEWGDD